MAGREISLPGLPRVPAPSPDSPASVTLERIRRFNRLRYFLPLVRQARVLDLDRGDGEWSAWFAREAAEVVAPGEGAAPAGLSRFNLRFGPVEGSFGVVAALSRVRTAPEAARASEEAAASLADGGILLLAVEASSAPAAMDDLSRKFPVVCPFGQPKACPWRPAPGLRNEDATAILACGGTALWRRLERFHRPTGIVILCHNNLADSDRCLRSVAQFTPEPIEIVLVDNGSTDGTAEWASRLEQSFGNVRVLRNARNLGYAPAVNQGLAVLPGRDVLLLNNDVVVTPGWLGGLLALLREDGTTGLVGAVSDYARDPQLIQTPPYGDNVEAMLAFAIRRAAERCGDRSEGRRLSGFCMLLRRELIERIGGLDERFVPGFFEDDDYSVRATLAGYRIRVAQDVFVHHVGNRTFKQLGLDLKQHLRDNWERFRDKWEIPADAPMGTYPARAHFDPRKDRVPLPCSASA